MIIKTNFTPIKCITITKFSAKNEKLGYACLIIYKRPNEELVGLVEDVFVDEKLRGNGIGSDIMQEVIKTAKETGCYKIVLSCADERINFYKRLGFKQYQNAMRRDL